MSLVEIAAHPERLLARIGEKAMLKQSHKFWELSRQNEISSFNLIHCNPESELCAPANGNVNLACQECAPSHFADKL